MYNIDVGGDGTYRIPYAGEKMNNNNGYLDGYLGKPQAREDEDYVRNYQRGERQARIDRCRG